MLWKAYGGFTSEWRRGWDSNPGSGEPDSGFQDRRIKPLCHPSNGGPSAARSHYIVAAPSPPSDRPGAQLPTSQEYVTQLRDRKGRKEAP